MSGDLSGPAKPWSKESALARGERRHTRKVAGKGRWQRIADEKQGPCRVCGDKPPNELHHLIARSQGGSDTEANIVPLCRACHGHIEARDPLAAKMLATSLTDAEYAFCIEHGGEGFFERRLGLRYERG